MNTRGLHHLSAFFLLLECAVASSSINPNNCNGSYCLNRQISIDITKDTVQVEGETAAINFYHEDNDEVESMDYDARNINNVAMFFHGGNLSSPTSDYEREPKDLSSFVAMSECAFVSYLQNDIDWNNEDYFDGDDEDDDDDDDDDDGHSSMLSNASIRKRVSVGVGASSSDTSRGLPARFTSNMKKNQKIKNGSNDMNYAFSSNLSKFTTTTSKKYDPLNRLLQVRGGASASPVRADEFAKRLIAAAVATLLYEGSIGHILEFLKIAMQTAPVGTTYISILKSITDEKGIVGAWDGFIPWGVVQSIFKGGVFGLAHAMAKTYLNIFVEKGLLTKQVALTLAGGIAGGFQGFVLSPTLLLKTRVMTNPVFRENMSLLKTTLLSFAIGFDVVKNEGLLALMKGADIFAMKRVFDWSTRYYFSDLFQSLMLQYGAGYNGVLSSKEKIAASLLAGTASTIMTLPLDVIVAKSQDAKKAGVKVSAWETFTQDFKVGGWKGLYDANMMGFEARLLHVCFTTVVMQFGSPLIFELLFKKK